MKDDPTRRVVRQAEQAEQVVPEQRSDARKAADEHWVSYAGAVAHSLQANGLLSSFVTNPTVTGLFAEAWVRSMARNMLGHRFKISTER